MTSIAQDPPPAASPAAAAPKVDRVRLAAIAHRLADPEFGTGALASLRRSEPATVLRQPACHRLLLDVDEHALGADGALRWATAVHLLALLAKPGRGWPDRTTGAALADARYSESRLARLLASRGDAFRDQAVLAARFLRGRDAACRPLDLAELALVEERAEGRADRLRHRIARDYYTVLDARATAH